MDSEPPQRWADVPDESKQQLLELANRPGVVDSKGRRWQPRQLMAEFGLTRRQATAAIAVLASGATLGSALQHAVGVASGAASETDSDGDVGQKSSRVDVFADGVDANSVSTDELFTTPAGAIIWPTSNQTVSTGTITQVAFDSADEFNNAASAFADLSNNGITIPTDDYNKIRVSGHIRTDNPISWELLRVTKNGSNSYRGRGQFITNGLTMNHRGVQTAWLDASQNDTYTLEFRHGEGNDQDIRSGDAETWLTLEAK